jgi:hypothetical protein
MPRDLFDCWRAYARIRPFGYADHLLAIIAHRVYNATRGDGPPLGLEAFKPAPQLEEAKRDLALETELLKAMNRNVKRKG